MTNFDIDAERLLPLPPAVFHILITLAEGDKHGYAVMQEVAERTGGRVRMSPGTLYGSIRKMLDDGLIEESFRRLPGVLETSVGYTGGHKPNSTYR